MANSPRNKILHSRGPSVYRGDYQITDKALENYDVERDKFGTTTVILGKDESFNVKDYQYELEDGKVGMYFIPISDYGTFTSADGQVAYGSQLVDAFIREKMGLKESDPLYAYMYYIHPELNKGTLSPSELNKDGLPVLTDPKNAKTEMGITHLGAYLGQGVTSNAPPLYHFRRWGVSPLPNHTEDQKNPAYGYPCNVMVLSMDGVDQAMLNKNLKLTDTVLNYGVRFPMDYLHSAFRPIDINTALMFYRDWIKEAPYLKDNNDKSWFTYCCAHKTLVTTVGLNLPHNEESFMEVYGAEEGKALYDLFVTNYFEIFGERFIEDHHASTHFEPLWKKEGLTPEQIRPFTLEEYTAYEKARREGKLDTFKGFKPLPPTKATGWGPQSAADVIFEWIDAYADFIDAGAVVTCAAIKGYVDPVTQRMGITEAEYWLAAMPILEIIMEADAKIYASSNPDSDYNKSPYYLQRFEELFIGFGGNQEDIPKALKSFPEFERFVGKLHEFVDYLTSNELKPEFLAWWALGHVRSHWKKLISEPAITPLEAYEWLSANAYHYFEKARDVTAPTANAIQFNVPPSMIHMIVIGMFAKNPHIQMKTICTVMDHSELEPKK